MEIICLTENIDPRDLNNFEEVFREDYDDNYKVSLLESTNDLLKTLNESTKRNEEILIIAENEIDRIKKITSYFLEDCDIMIFNTKSRMIENNVEVQQQPAQTQNAAQPQQNVVQQTDTQAIQQTTQNIVLVESPFNLATRESKVNAESIKGYLKNFGHQKNIAIRWIHNPVIPNVQRLSSGAESKIAQAFYGINTGVICDVLDNIESILVPSENPIAIICTDSCYTKVKALLGKDIKRPMVLKELNFDLMKQLIGIVSEVENDFKSKKVLMKMDDKDEQGKMAIVEECTNQNILTYFKLLSESLKIERQYSKTVNDANIKYNKEKKDIEESLKVIDNILGLSYELQGFINVMNDPENPLSGLLSAAKTVYNKAKTSLDKDKKKGIEKIKKKIEDVNNKSLSDVVAYFKIHSKWKEFSEIVDI